MDHYLQKFDLFIFYHQRADPDLWMRKTAEGGYYYMLQDTLMMFCIFQRIWRKLFTTLKIYTLKGVGHPQFYLGYVDADHARNNVTRRSDTGGYFE